MAVTVDYKEIEGRRLFSGSTLNLNSDNSLYVVKLCNLYDLDVDFVEVSVQLVRGYVNYLIMFSSGWYRDSGGPAWQFLKRRHFQSEDWHHPVETLFQQAKNQLRASDLWISFLESESGDEWI